MAIEITPQKEVKKALILYILLGFSLILFLSLTVSYFLIETYSEKTSLDIQKQEQLLIRNSSEKALEKELILYESKINTFGKLLKNHKKTINAFLYLQQICHPNVWFSNFDFDSSKEKVNLSGQAEKFMDVGQQLAILEDSGFFEQVTLTEISMDTEGGVNFSIDLVFSQGKFEDSSSVSSIP